jgi:branched-chain amino acid transport system permease protein
MFRRWLPVLTAAAMALLLVTVVSTQSPAGAAGFGAAAGAAPAPAPIAGRDWCGANVNCRDLVLQLLVFGLSNGAVLALNAIGVTLIYSIVRIVNLAHGDVFVLTTALVTTFINALGVQASWPPLLLGGALVLTLGAAVLFGALLSIGIERVAFKPFRGRSRLAPLIATLGISFMLYQVGLVWRTYQHSFIRGEHRSVPGVPEFPRDSIPDLLPNVNLIQAAGLPFHVVFRFSDLFVLLAAVLVVVVTARFMQRTATGRAIRACAQNPELARILGVNLDGTIWRAFAVGGALAGAAAFVFALYYTRPFGFQGAESGLQAFTAALLGGIGSPGGALLSGLLLGVVGSFSDYFLRAQWTPALLLLLLIGLLFMRPAGLGVGVGAEDTASNAIRDAVVLTEPGQARRSRNWLPWVGGAAAIFPILSLIFGWGGDALLRSVGIFILLALGLNLLLGLAGVLDLGYAISFGVGAYVTAILTNRYGLVGAQLPQPIDFTLVLAASIGLAALVGAVKGGLAVRLRGDYLAVATLALSLVGQRIIVGWNDVTGGSGGTSTIPPPTFLTLRVASPTAQYYLVFGLAALAAFASLRLIRSRTGRAWMASSEDEGASTSLGINIGRYNLLAFILSSALAGLAGSLYASTFAYVDPDLLAFHVSTLTLTMVILGGAGSVQGAILGTFAIIAYDKVIVPQLGALLALFWPSGTYIGQAPDIRGASFFNFGAALYLTVLIRARLAGRQWRKRLAADQRLTVRA